MRELSAWAVQMCIRDRVDIIDTAMSPFALGTSQPATEVMVEAFKGTEFDTGQMCIRDRCNPGTLSREKLLAYMDAGINRLSIGLQSANNDELKRCLLYTSRCV